MGFRCNKICLVSGWGIVTGQKLLPTHFFGGFFNSAIGKKFGKLQDSNEKKKYSFCSCLSAEWLFLLEKGNEVLLREFSQGVFSTVYSGIYLWTISSVWGNSIRCVEKVLEVVCDNPTVVLIYGNWPNSINLNGIEINAIGKKYYEVVLGNSWAGAIFGPGWEVRETGTHLRLQNWRAALTFLSYGPTQLKICSRLHDHSSSFLLTIRLRMKHQQLKTWFKLTLDKHVLFYVEKKPDELDLRRKCTFSMVGIEWSIKVVGGNKIPTTFLSFLPSPRVIFTIRNSIFDAIIGHGLNEMKQL